MRINVLVLAFLLSGLGAVALQAQAQAQAPQYVRVKQDDTIGCGDAATLRELHRTMARVTPGPGWERGIHGIGCGQVAADLRWRFADLQGDVAMTQMATPGISMAPVMWFRVSDLVDEQGQPFRPAGRPAPLRR